VSAARPTPLLLASPFRLFFLLAATMAALWMPAWGAIWLRATPLATDLTPLGWHVHEMVFGYTGAVLAGFLLTAARNWTGRETLRGPLLAVLAVLWCAGRAVAGHGARLPEALGPIVDGAFFALIAVALARPILAARSWRNLAFPILILVLGACDVVVHLYVHGHLGLGWGIRAFDVSINAIVVIIVLFGGRIVPMFTRNATGGAVRARGWLDWAGLGAVWAYAAVDAVAPGHAVAHAGAIAAGALNGARLFGWGGSRTLRRPELWVLHLGWAFLALGLIATGAAGFTTRVPPGAATHLLAVVGIGVMTLGMMARVALGHTGRPLRAPALATAGFVLLVLGTVARVAAPLSGPHYGDLVWIAVAAWAAGFAAFVAGYAPILLSPRVDGKPD
jgi:uncharacterized protein involved in response to NO